MPVVVMPDGARVRFPDDMPREQIRDMIATKFPELVPSKGFQERVGEDMQQRYKNAEDIGNRYYAGQQTNPETLFQAGTNAVGAVGDIGTNIIGSGGRYLNDMANYIAPETTKDIKANIGDAGKYLANTQLGQAALGKVGNATSNYSQFTQDHQRAAANLKGVNDLLIGTPLLKGGAAASNFAGDVLGNAGMALEDAVQKQIANKADTFFKNLVTPEQTKSVKIDQVKRTTEKGGILNRKIVEPSFRQREVMDEVSKISGVHPKNTLQGNYNVIDDALTKEAEGLKLTLEKNDVPIKIQDFHDELQNVVGRLAENPLITGDAEKTALKLVKKAQQLSAKNPATASGLLQARKDLDSWVKSQKGAGVFDPAKEGALSIALREVRQSVNDFIDSKAVGSDVRASLRKQSNLYNALENIAPKAAKEKDNRFGRAVQGAADKLPLKSDTAKDAALLLGAAGIGAGTYLSAPTLAAAAGIYGLGRVAASPVTKNLLGITLTNTGKILRGGKQFTAKELKELPLDERKAVIQEINKLKEKR